MLHSTPNSTTAAASRRPSPTAAFLSAGAFTLALAPLFAVGSTLVAGAAAASAPVCATPQAGPADRIFAKHRKTGKVQALTGVVTEAGLDGVKYTDPGDDSESVAAIAVVQIQWGVVPNSFTDGETYAKRGEWESAVANFQTAATDGDAREAVKAAARLRSLECMMEWGASEPARFTDAIAEADRFLADHSADWKVPTVRGMKARATWLTGDADGARDGYKSLFEAGKDGAKGFAPLATAQAALEGARAALESAETSTARELFDLAGSAFDAIDSNDEATMAVAKGGAEVARMAAAESQLAKGDFSGAARGFESALRSAKTSAGKGTATLGLGRALLGEKKYTEAQIHLAWVAGLDHTSDDRRAAALLALGQALVGQEGGASLGKGSLQRVAAEFGATPSAAKALKVLEGL